MERKLNGGADSSGHGSRWFVETMFAKMARSLLPGIGEQPRFAEIEPGTCASRATVYSSER